MSAEHLQTGWPPNLIFGTLSGNPRSPGQFFSETGVRRSVKVIEAVRVELQQSGAHPHRNMAAKGGF